MDMGYRRIQSNNADFMHGAYDQSDWGQPQKCKGIIIFPIPGDFKTVAIPENRDEFYSLKGLSLRR